MGHAGYVGCRPERECGSVTIDYSGAGGDVAKSPIHGSLLVSDSLGIPPFACKIRERFHATMNFKC